MDVYTDHFGTSLKQSSMISEEYKNKVRQAKEHIFAGDIFQIVLSQRFERRTFADPFEVYRALRVVNPSPYMTYLQVRSLQTKNFPIVTSGCLSTSTIKLIISLSHLIRLEGVF